VIITDSIPPRPDIAACSKIKVLSVSRLLGEAVKRIHPQQRH
jgi:phosphoribosylpyrophosphate synthetase